ncbi:carbamoyltransferase HypF [Desulfallas thermosapovorans]|uniref:Carbamoyltransferase n=1 Tax=Desulfallas thermosapovorans DSM 6562 TaxID=1121431 RepID=A0A5S4ZTI9_9FIRM|nr:carbamoyltransferase HypF [Desulfallas thermosapovorans]TYO95408.1 Hydrogenase maturation protein, carbamoyltransferase HypF [Desulfallas thermosapovorans DSM 6562]
MGEIVAREISITGVVQGVGFRPFVYNLARSYNLTGTVCNTGRGVLVYVEGPPESVAGFTGALRANPPFLARIHHCEITNCPPRGGAGFSIIHTRGGATGESVVPPDVATCPDCRREIKDPSDRHYRYPFTNCTSCGPRFTIVKNLPYDRPGTAMAGFTMCPSCAAEYHDPAHRRFHAQPVACPDCGPRVELVDRHGRVVEGDWLGETGRLLEEGKIIAVKGLGGFHLACSGVDPVAVQRLRRRKGRPARPLAVMCRDLAVVREHCRVTPREEALLCSPAAPIVILQRKTSSTLPRELAPGLNSIGVMLPYTPLHILLLQNGPAVLVMTSGNRSGLPLVKDNGQALARLGDVVDYFLWHDRDIVNRCDDSVVGLVDGQVQFLRRSRGYVPQPVTVLPAGENTGRPGQGKKEPVPETGVRREITVLGAGGDMKNTFCLLKGNRAYLSPHIGAVDVVEGMENYRTSLANFSRLIQACPQVVGYDLHPDYHSSRIARELADNAIAVQHHHAHMASCMAEHGLEGQVIGVVLDGTGYGPDGCIWGFEVLVGDYLDFSRRWHLAYIPLPGGEQAVRNPWMTAVAYLVTALGERGYKVAEKLFPHRLNEIAVIGQMLRAEINSPLASSCGRFFDAAAALLGVCPVNTYDGQAAVELGELVPCCFDGTRSPDGLKPASSPDKTAGEPASAGYFKAALAPYPFNLNNGIIKTGATVAALVRDIERGLAPALIARRFHDTIISMVVQAVEKVRSQSGPDRVVLSGGCWHNRYMLTAVCKILGDKGYQVYRHVKVPTGDGGISLGQAMVAARKYFNQGRG